jgi:hypothetical protein
MLNQDFKEFIELLNANDVRYLIEMTFANAHRVISALDQFGWPDCE